LNQTDQAFNWGNPPVGFMGQWKTALPDVAEGVLRAAVCCARRQATIGKKRP
jgi:hypothetical protein